MAATLWSGMFMHLSTGHAPQPFARHYDVTPRAQFGSVRGRQGAGAHFVMGLLLCLSFYSLLFQSQYPGAQIMAVALYIVTGLLGAMNASFKVKFGRMEILLFSAVVLSLIGIAVHDFGYDGMNTKLKLTGYNVLLSCSVLSSFFIARSLAFWTVWRIAAIAFAAMLLSVMIFHPTELWAGLQASSGRWGSRLTAFDLHPNLLGLMFTGGAIVLATQGLRSNGIKRVLCWAAAPACLLVTFSASARGSLVAMAIGAIVVLPLIMRRLNPQMQRIAFAGVVLLVILAAVGWPQIWNYLVVILELHSDARGFDSGATGRTELWAMGINYIFSSPFVLMFGTGIRSSTPDLIGFSTESSYISILIDSGIIFGSAIILCFVCAMCKSFVWRKQKYFDLSSALLSVFMVFMIFESFFNRYLLGIGNPISLFTLLVTAYMLRGPLRSA